MSPHFIHGRENVPCIAEVVNRSLKADCTDFRQLEPLPPKPTLSDYYVPSEDHHNCELAFITISIIGIGAFLWYSDK